MSDSAPKNDPTQPALPAGPTDDALPAGDRFDADLALLRLLVGGMLVGGNELRDRLRQWEDVSRQQARAAAPPQSTSAWLRNALVGMAFAGETRLRQGFSTMLSGLTSLADESNLAYTRLALALRRTPFDPVRRRLDEMFFLTSAALDRLTERGWIEEQRGRHMAERATVSVIDELLDYMARNPDVRNLIEQQGASMADSAVGEVRERTASADQWIERLAHNLLHRPANEAPAKPEDAPAPPAEIRTSPAAARARTKVPTAPARAPAAIAGLETTPSSNPG